MSAFFRRHRLGFFVGALALIAAIAAIQLFYRPHAGFRVLRLPEVKTAQNFHNRSGPVRPPRPVPDVKITLDDGSETRLPSLLAGHWTIAQFMFTGCSTTCPIQGAIFARTESQLAARNIDAQLLSISIDPLGDDAASLARWLEKLGHGRRWRAAVPPFDDLGLLLDALSGRSKDVDLHEARAFLIDPGGQLVFVTDEMPDPASLVELVSTLQSRS